MLTWSIVCDKTSSLYKQVPLGEMRFVMYIATLCAEIWRHLFCVKDQLTW